MNALPDTTPATAEPGKIHTPFPEAPAQGTTIEVAPGIHWARLPLPMALDHVNVYALDDGDGWTVVDTGFATSKTKAIWRDLLQGPLAGKPVKRIIGTHHHPDHIGLAAWFMAQGAELAMPRTGWLMARMLTLDVQDRPSPEAMRFYTHAGMDREEAAKRLMERPFNFADCVMLMPQGYTRLKDGDTIQMAGRWKTLMHHSV